MIHRFRTHHLLGVLVLVLVTLSGSLTAWVTRPPSAQAQIVNGTAGQPFASVVDCLGFAAPRFATTCFGTRITAGGYGASGGSLDANAADPALVGFGDATPDGVSDLDGAPSHAPLANVGQIGAVYGLAYSSGGNSQAPGGLLQQRRLFAGAFTKMQTRYGVGGPGAIYQINLASGAVSLYVQIPDVVPGPNGLMGDPGDGTQPFLYNDATEPSYTPEMGGIHKDGLDELTNGVPFGGRQFAAVGKTSLGDVELSPDERYLFVVNLNTRQVYRFDTWAATPQATLVVLPDWLGPLGACATAGGTANARPFGLHVTEAALYLGVVCSAESSQSRAELSAGVARYDRASGTWSWALTFGLSAFDTQRNTSTTPTVVNPSWQAWRNGVLPVGNTALVAAQPLVSDIVFDEQGNMLLGLRDRTGDMNSEDPYSAPARAEGDLLLATPSGSPGVWNAPTSAGAEEFQDSDLQNSGRDVEAANGGLALVPGTHSGGYGGEVVSTFLDPYRPTSYGAAWWDSAGGAPTAYEEIYAGGTVNHVFGKAAGVGDLELLCAWRALGDRVWRDSNSNGVQDLGEPDLAGVRVQLLDASGAVVATVTSGSVAGMSGNYRFYVDPFARYTLRIDPAMFGPGQPLFGLGLTTANVGGNDAADSDADASGTIPIAPAGNGDVTVTFDFGLVAGANVRIAKSGPATALPGQSVAYTLSYANDGPASAQTVTVVDTLPTGLTFVSASPAPSSVSGNTLTWSLGTLTSGASGSISVQAQTSSSASGTLSNQAQISTSTPNDDPSDNSSTATTTIVRPNVTLQKTGPATVTAGSTLAYTLSYRNTGSAPAAGVQLVDTLPAGVAFVSASPAPSSVAGQVVTWNVGTLVAGASGSISVQAQTSASVANGAALTNQAQISTTTAGDSPGDNSSSVTTTVQRADVAVVKTSPDRFPVASGQLVTFYLDYQNNGPAAAAGVTISDTVPPQLTSVVWACVSGCTDAGSGSAIRIAVGTLPVGASGRVRVTGTAQTTLAREDFTNTAVIATSTPETSAANNTSQAAGSVGTADVSIAKSMPAFALDGATFTATLRYANAGPVAADAVVLRDLAPSGLTFVSSTPPPTGPGLRWNLGTLAPGASGVITVTFQVAALTPDGTTYTNIAVIDTSTPDRDGSNDTASATMVVRPLADLALVKTGPAAPVLSGSRVSYTLTYTNAGPSLARSAVVSDTLPPGFSLQTSAPVPASAAGEVLRWALGDLAAGTSGTIVLTGTLTGDAATTTTTRVNTAGIGSATSDPQIGNNTSSVTTTVLLPDLAVLKTDGVTQAQPGDVLTYTLTIRNSGPISATGVVLIETPPAPILDPAWTPSGSGSYTLSIGTVGPGVVLTRTVTIPLPNPLPSALQGTIVNTVRVRAGCCTDPTPGDTTATDTDTPLAGRLGDYIWLDSDGDGQQDAGERGLAGVPLELLDPTTGLVLATTTTDPQGHYVFTGLRLGRYAVRITPQAMTTIYRAYSITTAPVPATTLTPQAPRDDTLDIGLEPSSPTAVQLAYLLVEPLPRGRLVRWGTLAEQHTRVFRVERSTRLDRGDAVIVAIVPSLGSQGGDYLVTDYSTSTANALYWLIEVEGDGHETVYGPALPQPQATRTLSYMPLVPTH